ncbi:hypothetical protein [Neisseria sp. Ec49-e6-T10]|uniref:hypothetical protein n=1 Tax=Neisseria sp. Ec49-e6-T10 TaxID=3140744 RepID=UPI003EB9878A
MKNVLSFMPAYIGVGDAFNAHRALFVRSQSFDCPPPTFATCLSLYLSGLSEENSHGD